MNMDEFLEAEAGKHIAESEQNATTEEFISNRTLEDQIRKIRELIKQRKYGDAEKIYYVVKSHYANMEKKQSDERRDLHRELTEVNKELITSLNEMRGELDKRSTVIRQLLIKAKEYIQSGDMYKANKIYLEVKDMFKALPEVFSEKKAELENEIMGFYGHLVREFNKKTYSKLTEKGKLIENHILTALGYLKTGHMEAAKKEYDTIYQLYTELPEGYLYEKTMIYNQILSLHKLTESGVKTTEAKEEVSLMQEELAKATNKGSPTKMEPPKLEEVPTPETKKEQPKFIPPQKDLAKVKNKQIEAEDAVSKKEEKKGFFSFLKKEKTEEKQEAKNETDIEQKISVKTDTEMENPPVPSM